MIAEPPRESRGATEDLLRFASSEADSPTATCFDEADVSASSLGESVHNASWWDSGKGGLKLRKRQMAGMGLRRANLSVADLGGANLANASGGGVLLRNACLEGTILTGADLVGADLTAVDAGEADFGEALLEDANFTRAQLRFANFSSAVMDGADLSDADLWGARFRSAAAERAKFHNARLDESSLTEAEFNGADFAGATLRRANLSGARLRDTNFRDAILDGADLSSADLSGAILANVSLASCKLLHARFAGAWLERTRMRAKQLGGMVGEEAAGDLEAAVESYIVLERNFISLGSTEDSSWAYLRKRRVGRALHARQAKSAFLAKRWKAAVLSSLRYCADVTAEWLCDYGESLARVVRAFFTILILFAAAYWLTGSLTLKPGLNASRFFSVINYLLFSLDSMTTVGTSEVALRPSGELGILMSSLQTVIGTVLLGLFGFVLGARIRN